MNAYEMAKSYYERGLWSKERLDALVEAGWVTIIVAVIGSGATASLVTLLRSNSPKKDSSDGQSFSHFLYLPVLYALIILRRMTYVNSFFKSFSKKRFLALSRTHARACIYKRENIKQVAKKTKKCVLRIFFANF